MQQNYLRNLENSLVKEFRACQALLHLMREEQFALANGDAARLLAIAERKDILLDRLAVLSQARQSQVAALNGGAPGDAPSLEELTACDTQTLDRMRRLSDGIQVLTSQARELVQANQALAAAALKRAAAQQAGLISSTQTSLPALFAAILDARDALDAQDSAAVRLAIGDLQKALNRIGTAADHRPARSHPVLEPSKTETEAVASQPAGAPSRSETNLVEAMASLYRQEKAYRAVLQTGYRMLTGA
jgi:flagellar biosynthesis/type III secretory pathway chaperone